MDALVAELDDRVDHLLLLGLEDALFATLLDDQAELLGADPLVGRTSAPNRRLIRRVVQVRNATSGPKTTPRTSMRRLVDIATRSAWARPICLGTSSPKMIVKIVRSPGDDDQRDPVAAPASGPNVRKPGGHPVDQADRRERGGQEAEEVDPDLDDRQEAARLLLEPQDAGGAAVAFVDELLEAAAADRDERDLGRREDAVEKDEHDDDGEFEEALTR